MSDIKVLSTLTINRYHKVEFRVSENTAGKHLFVIEKNSKGKAESSVHINTLSDDELKAIADSIYAAIGK